MDRTIFHKMPTGITGLDAILDGGLHPHRVYLVEGNPGTGKTTLAMQFLRAGIAAGERVLYITLSETEDELRKTMESHGWENREAMTVFELSPADMLLDSDQQQSLLYSSDLELGETTKQILHAIEQTRPHRVVVDSLAEIRLLAQGSLRFRRQILSMKHFFARHGMTVMMLDDLTAEESDRAVHSIVSGVIRLEELAPEYGAERRRFRIVKYRGAPFSGGYHDFDILTGGVKVYPRLVAAQHKQDFRHDRVPSGVGGLDALVGGGLTRGTCTLVIGPAGAGKSILALHYAYAALEAGEAAALYLFEEDVNLYLHRARGVGFDLVPHLTSGRATIEQIDPAELSPGEFAHMVANAVEEKGAKTIVVDSLNGYKSAMPHENFLLLHMHELLSYLNRHGATTIVTAAQHGVLASDTSVDLTYLSDTLFLLRFFEAEGAVRRAISVIKNRAGAHESAIRELQITPSGIKVGEPLRQFSGILTGVPAYMGTASTLLDRDGKS